MRALGFALTSLALCAGCDPQPPSPSSTAACGTEARPWGSPDCPVAPPSPPSPPAPKLPNTVIQVEVSGRVVLPNGAPDGSLMVVLTDGPCFQAGTHYLGAVKPALGGNYLMTVFPPVDTKLEACGALVEPMRSGVSWWGRADRGTMAVQGRGKMIYRETNIPLRHGPDVPLPVGLKLTP